MTTPFSSSNFKMSSFESSNRQKTFESLDLPNFLNTTADTGNMAYFDDSIWYRSLNGWLPLVSSSTNSEGNTVQIIDRSTTESAVIPASSNGWSGQLSFKFFRVGKIVNLIVFGLVTATANVTAWTSSTPIIPAAFLPPIVVSGPIDNLSLPTSALNIQVQDDGRILIRKPSNQLFITGDEMLLTTQTFTYPVDFVT